MTYRIKDWDRHFEVAQSRLIKGRMTWVAMPTKHDGLGYKRVMRAGPLHYAAWVLLVEVAAKCPTRGLLVNSDRALTPEDLEVMTEFPAKHFAAAFPVLVSVGWLEVVADTANAETLLDNSEQSHSAVVACSVHKTGQYSTVHNRTTSAHSGECAADALELYEAYPLHKAKPAALRAITKALKKADKLTLLKAIAAYRAECARTQSKLAYPATWFNQERWGDEPLLEARPLSRASTLPDVETATGGYDATRHDDEDVPA